jgi:hypothetical protein
MCLRNILALKGLAFRSAISTSTACSKPYSSLTMVMAMLFAEIVVAVVCLGTFSSETLMALLL